MRQRQKECEVGGEAYAADMPKGHLKVDEVVLNYRAICVEKADRQQEIEEDQDCIGAMEKDFEILVVMIQVAYGRPEQRVHRLYHLS